MSENLERNRPDRGEQERAMRLMEALSGVDERILERCIGEDRVIKYRKSLWRSTRAVAAVLCLAVVGALSWGGYQLANMRMGSSDSSGGAAGGFELKTAGDNAAPPEAVSGETAAEMDAEEALPAEGGQDDQTKLTNQTQQMPAGQSEDTVAADKGQSQPQKEMDGSDGNVYNFGATQETAEKEGGSGQDNGAAENQESAEPDYGGCPRLESEKFTEAQARADAALGAYIPLLLPDGYVFEDAYHMPEDSEANLTICWSRGMDSIVLRLKKTASLPRTVNVERPELYDESLYEIPYGESVPEEYREIFNNPVFAAEDLSLDVVKSRMMVYEDQGDTDTPRGNFGVLYPNGVLVRFSGRGTAEEIWEMFCSMKGEE